MGEEYFQEAWSFEWNNQKAILNCVCGEQLELFSDEPTVCEHCGRMYWIESIVKVDWSFRKDEPLLIL